VVIISHDNGTLKIVQNPLAKLNWVITEARQDMLYRMILPKNEQHEAISQTLNYFSFQVMFNFS
jgi:hypothetical protein